jgi:preprotein translocase subunit SecA
MVMEIGSEIVDILVDDFEQDRKNDAESALARLGERLMQNFQYQGRQDAEITENISVEDAKSKLMSYLQADIDEKIDIAGRDQLELFIRYEYLRQLDLRWQEHLEELVALGESVRLRSYAQKNPLVEYKNEGFEIFDSMLDEMRIEIARKVFKVRIRRKDERHGAETRVAHASHTSMPSLVNARSAIQTGERKEAAPTAMQVKRSTPKVGRNDPCPCGSGKKYKNCCGA